MAFGILLLSTAFFAQARASFRVLASLAPELRSISASSPLACAWSGESLRVLLRACWAPTRWMLLGLFSRALRWLSASFKEKKGSAGMESTAWEVAAISSAGVPVFEIMSSRMIWVVRLAGSNCRDSSRASFAWLRKAAMRWRLSPARLCSVMKRLAASSQVLAASAFCCARSSAWPWRCSRSSPSSFFLIAFQRSR